MGIPVFSVDYRLAPKNPYPDPQNDCYQAYVWIVTQAKAQLGLDADQIIVAGDSAGGHLAMTVTFLSILRGFRKSDGVLCHYPVFSLDENRFFPSHLIAIDEEFITSCFLKFSMACFNRRRAEQVNPIMSPIHAPTSLIRQLPPCKFIVAQIDALRDQAFHMALRILKNGGKVQIVVMEEFIHGF